MKKYILILFLLLIFTFSVPNAKAIDNTGWILFKKTTGEYINVDTRNGDNIKLQKKTTETLYRVVLNDGKALYLNIDGKAFAYVNFFESTSYYFLYGAAYREIDTYSKDAYKPYIIRMNKDLSESIIRFDLREDIGNTPYYTSMMEFGADNLIVTELYNGTFNGITYNGLYVVHSMDKDLNIISSVETANSEITLSVAYDVIDLRDARNNHTYFDINFNRIDSYKRSEDIEGYFELYTDTIVNDVFYPIGTIFSNPGIYVLEDGYHEKKTITLSPSVKLLGDMEGEYYKESVSYQVSGGLVEINGESANLNGTIYKPGSYILKIKGIDSYTTQKSFVILPEFLTHIENNSLNVGDTLKFTGTGILNGNTIDSGYKIENPGNYTFYLLAGDKVVDEIKFNVPDEVVTEESRTYIYIIYAGIVVAIISAILIAVFANKKKNIQKESKS
ncbi:hypothetical protein J6Y73_03445 [bacterium]|nr:hypothetical protein [bacterium]